MSSNLDYIISGKQNILSKTAVSHFGKVAMYKHKKRHSSIYKRNNLLKTQ